MSSDRALQSGAAVAEMSQGAGDLSHQRRQWSVGDPIPVTVGDLQLAAMLGIALSTFYARKRRGDYRFLELKPQLAATNTKYSGFLVARWLRGENVTPGAPRPHFGSARERGNQGVAVTHGRLSGRTGRPRKQREASVGETPTAGNGDSLSGKRVDG